MPGFEPRPTIEYYKQVVPPPRRAWVKSVCTDAEMVIGHERMFWEPLQSDGESLSSKRMHRVHLLARRIVDFGTHYKFVLESKGDAAQTPVQQAYISSIKTVQKEIDMARKFQYDLVKQLNPNVGMLMAYADIGKSFRMFDIEESNVDGTVGCAPLTPTSKKRKIYLCVDALSAKIFCSLELNLTKKLTEIGSSEYVEALLSALSLFTCQHNYLHEHRMHRQDVIWRQFYGCVLQAFQAETRTLRINGDP
eukprot:scaffold47887_cov21-Cyclotella_meneghiniana.AAC.1